jgi:hypothetical protein
MFPWKMTNFSLIFQLSLESIHISARGRMDIVEHFRWSLEFVATERAKKLHGFLELLSLSFHLPSPN